MNGNITSIINEIKDIAGNAQNFFSDFNISQDVIKYDFFPNSIDI